MKSAAYLILVLTVFRFLFITQFPLLGDEAYYWQWSRHLDWGYYEQGPIVAGVLYLFTFFSKFNNLWTVRWGAVVLGSISMFLWSVVYQKLNVKNIFWNLLLINTSLIYALGPLVMMHDTVMIFFFSAFLVHFVDLIQMPHRKKYWIYCGIWLALGILSKLTLGVIYIGVVLLLVLTGHLWTYRRNFFLFSGTIMLLSLPFIYWNFSHNFATIEYLLLRGSSKKAQMLQFFGELIVSQWMLIGPILFPILIYFAFKEIKERKFSIPFAFSLFFFVGILPFVLLSFKSRVEANWPAFVVLPVLLLSTPQILAITSKRFLVFFISMGIGLVVFAHFLIVYPVLPARLNPLKKAYGFKELSAIVQKEVEAYTEPNQKVFLGASYYQNASLLSFYFPGQKEFFVPHQEEGSKNFRFWRHWQESSYDYAFYVYEEAWENEVMKKIFRSPLQTKEVQVDISPYGQRTFFIDIYKASEQ